MLHQAVENILNTQIKLEADSSNSYLAMAVWADTQGLNGIADFLYAHSDEERLHMLKLVKFVNERGGKAVIPELLKPKNTYESVLEVFESILSHEVHVTNSINEVVFTCLEQKDYTTHNFMQWFVSEQIEEESLARTILDKLKLACDSPGGLYLFDRDLATIKTQFSKEHEQ